MASERQHRLAQQMAVATPGFLGHALSALARQEDRSLENLLEEIGAAGDASPLLLCKMPRAESRSEDVQRIADLARVDARALASVLQRADGAVPHAAALRPPDAAGSPDPDPVR